MACFDVRADALATMQAALVAEAPADERTAWSRRIHTEIVDVRCRVDHDYSLRIHKMRNGMGSDAAMTCLSTHHQQQIGSPEQVELACSQVQAELGAVTVLVKNGMCS